MKRICVISLFVMLSAIPSFGQQLPQYTQYMLNDYAFNPAIAGTKDYYRGVFSQRYQWAGIDDAPRTFIMSANGPLKNRKMGLGGYLMNDKTGPASQTSFYLSYSYIIKLNDAFKASFALSGGLMQYVLDGSKVLLEDPDDNVLSNGIQYSTLPDAGFGFYLYTNRFYFGGSAPQLFNSRYNFFENGINGEASLERHYYFTSGVRLGDESSLAVTPSLLLKYVDPVPVQIEGSVKADYMNLVWLGLTYRHEDALAILVGFNYLNNLSVGYSYDILMSDMKNYSSGSHEIVVGINFMRALPKK